MSSPVTMKVSQVALLLDGEVAGNGDHVLTGLAKIEEARSGDLTFVANPKYKQFIKTSEAGAILISKGTDLSEFKGINFIQVEDPYYAFVKLFSLFFPPEENLPLEVSPLASIDETAQIGINCRIAPFVYVGPGCKVGNDVQLYPGVVLVKNVTVDDQTTLYPNVSIRENCQIGKRVIVHNGTVIGSDGFGFAFQKGRYHKIPQLGIVVVEDDVELGANVTIDRATLGETRIKSGTKLDNLIQIAHNVEVGSHTVMAAQSGISGSTKVGNYVMMGGQVGVVGHSRIGDRVQIGAQSGVAKSVEDGEIIFGSPARPMMKTKRIEAVINNLPDLAKKVNQLQKEVDQLRKKLQDKE